MNKGKQAAIGRTARSFIRRIHRIEILNPPDLGPLKIQYCVLLCEVADNLQNFLSRYSKKYVIKDDSRHCRPCDAP